MKRQSEFASESAKNLLNIKLTPETDSERELLEKNIDNDTIQVYYHMAIMEKLGKNFSLLKVVDQSQWPYAAQVLVQETKGLGE